MMNLRNVALACAVALCPVFAQAQTVLSRPTNFTYGATPVPGPPQLQVGLDTATGAPCIIGQTATCAMPNASAGSVSTPGVTASVTAINATSVIVRPSAGKLYDAYCYSSAAGNCIVYNSATVPAAGALTAGLVLDCAPVGANGTGGVTYPSVPETATAGIVVLFSSATGAAACNTYTASATAYIHARATP